VLALGLALGIAVPTFVAAQTTSPGGSGPASGGASSKKAEAERQMHLQVLQAHGRYEDERLQAYVTEVGQRVAAKSDRPDLQYTFTVLDSEDVNAMALPGGYVYVHRGLLAYLDSEAELAAVLGHEIGHITANHTARRQSSATAAGLGTALVGILTGNAGLMSAADMAGQMMVLGYSREQESEADELGLKFSTGAGYPPDGSVDSMQMMRDLELFSIQRAREEKRTGQAQSSWFSSHPDPGKRVGELGKLAASHPAAGEERPDGRDAYLAQIDGLVFGSSRAQGQVRGSRFYHADMGLTVAFPSGWSVNNLPNQVVAVSPQDDAVIKLSAVGVPPDVRPREIVARLFRGMPTTGGQDIEVNGLEGYETTLRSTGLPWGNQGPSTVAVVYLNGLAYVFQGGTKLNAAHAAFEPLFMSSVRTFRRLRDNEYQAAEPDRIRVIRAREGETIEQLAARSPLRDYPAEQLRLLNGLYPNREPQSGQALKVVD
jgi:predicted Zn-dependent protease